MPQNIYLGKKSATFLLAYISVPDFQTLYHDNGGLQVSQSIALLFVLAFFTYNAVGIDRIDSNNNKTSSVGLMQIQHPFSEH